jgi:hypothetical protein
MPDNGKDYKVFGESHIEDIAKTHDLKVLGKLPIDPRLSELSDKGAIEVFEGDWLDGAADILDAMAEKDKQQ